jgi:hypothetical protein
MCQPETLDRARELLENSKRLAETSEARLADAFIVAAQDEDAALGLLAPINTPAARSEALRIVTNSERAAGAIRVGRKSGFDARFIRCRRQAFCITNELAAERW